MNQEDVSTNTQDLTPEDHVKEILPDFHEEQRLHALEEGSTDMHPTTPRFEKLLETLKGLSDPEQKLATVIQFMEQAIAQTGMPHFKEFWEARRISLDLFKENINPSVRVAEWAKYSEACRQARRLKELFNEQSAFAVEQIEMAVAGIEKEVQHFPELLEKMAPVDFGVICHTIQPHIEEYDLLQRELNLLNAYATRTNALRKELIKTEMRIRYKNKFFERLSTLGDKIFPRRKALIQEVSSRFLQDIDRFIQTTFVSELKTPQLFDVREEIKALQSIAKVLTLNTEAFSQTRKSLSECWDSIKNVVKERRKVFSEQKAAYKEHRDAFMQEIEQLKAAFSSETPVADSEAKLEDLVTRMRHTTLGKLEIRELRDEVRKLRELLSTKHQAQDLVRAQEVQKRQSETQAKFEKVRTSLQELIEQVMSLEYDKIAETEKQLSKESSDAGFTRTQKQQLEKLHRQLREAIEDKKDRELLQLSDGDKESLSQLKSVLKEARARRQEIKNKMDSMRKTRGGSGLDFTQAMQMNEEMEAERRRLETIEANIEEIEQQILKLQRQKQ